ncbi:MAG: hypothetical protein VB144_05920 [Clostridia bacterium]|nr:hypothetical protein [Clostridia bacterium]
MRAIAYIHIPFLYAAVHAKLDPGIAGRPLAVVNKNTVVGVSPELAAVAPSAAPGCTRRHVRQSCPDAVIVEYSPELYAEFSNAILDICADYTPLVDPDSMLSAFADLTGCGDPEAICQAILSRASEGAGLDIGVGLAGSRLIAKMAVPTKECAIITPGAEAQFLARMPVRSIWPLSLQVLDRLEKLGVRTIAQLAAIPTGELTSQLGEAGLEAHLLSMGIDRSPVRAGYPPESIECSVSFEAPVGEWSDILQCLEACAAEIGSKLRSSARAASWIEASLEPTGGSAAVCTACIVRRHSFHTPSSSTTQISRALVHIATMAQNRSSSPIAGIRLRAGSLVSPSGVQLSMFDPASAGIGSDSLEEALKYVRKRFGMHSLITANALVRSRRDRMIAESLL